MSLPLRISEVTAQKFGGWDHQSLALPKAPFVVVHGPNQAGKSTLAELIIWMLTGTSGVSAEAAGVFGSHSEPLSANLRGYLGTDEFRSTGTFKLYEGRPPKTELTVKSAVFQHDLDSWRALLGGVDSAVLRSIYRLWGADLHRGGGVAGQLDRLTFGAFGASADPSGPIKALRDEARKRSTSKAAGVTSVASIHQVIGKQKQMLLAAERNAEDYRILELQSETSLSQASLLERQFSETVQRVRSLRGALRAQTPLRLGQDLRLKLQGIPVLSPQWAEVVAEQASILDATLSLATEQAEVTELKTQVQHACTRLGTSPGVLTCLAFSEDLPRTVAAQVQTLDHLGDALQHARDRARHASKAQAEASGAASSALNALPGVTLDEVTRAIFGQEERAAIGEARLRAENAVKDHANVLAACSESSVRLQESESLLGDARFRWEALGQNVPAEEWIRSGSTLASGSASASGSDHQAGSQKATGQGSISGRILQLLPAVLLAGFAMTLFATGQPALGAIALAFAAASLAVRLFANDAAPVAALIDANDPLHRSTTNAALEVIDCGRSLANAQRDHEANISRAESARLQADDLAVEMAQLAAGFGVRLQQPLAGTKAELTSWATAVEAVTEHARFVALSEVADQDVLDAKAKLNEERLKLKSTLSDNGIPAPTDLAEADATVAAYVKGVELANGLRQAQAAERASAERLEQLLTPVRTEITGWSLERIRDHVETLHASQQLHDTLAQQVAQTERTLDSNVGDDAQLRSLVDENLSSDELNSLLSAAEAEVEDLTREVASAREEVGRINGELDVLKSREEIADLTSTIGALQEQQLDLAIEACARSIAADMLERVAEDYRRDNQPEVIGLATKFARTIDPQWQKLLELGVTKSNELTLGVDLSTGGHVPERSLSTGAQALLHLSLRLAMADHDERIRGVSLPLICDDPLVHLDDERAEAAGQLLALSAERRQVLLFTCHGRTVNAALANGAALVEL